jgi:hypothetical protein
MPGTWLVETAHRRSPWTPPEAVEVWTIRSGNATEAGARAEARQCGPHWRRQGLRVRVRFEQ